MISDLEITSEYLAVLNNKYKIIDHVNLLSVDFDFALLEKFLNKTKKSYYQANERYIIEHFDTDYYLPEFPYGLTLYNLFIAFKKLDIPLFTMLIITNSFGIEHEINALAPDCNDRPTVITTFISHLHYTNEYCNVDVDAKEITVPGICMMSRSRVHRHALYNFFERESLLDFLAVTK